MASEIERKWSDIVVEERVSMKGFPNQIADFGKVARALRVVQDLSKEGKNARKDDVFGERLVREGILGTGHTARPVEEYLKEQYAKDPSYRSFQTTARGLRELFRILGLARETKDRVVLTTEGRQIASFAGQPETREQFAVWGECVWNMAHDGGDGETSHPYQVLLRLIAKHPGITRAKCALALEAKNDSESELNRIVALSDFDEEEIRRRIGETQTNWDNAKKILPSFAEQLGDVRKTGDQMYPSSDMRSRSSGAPGTPRQKPSSVKARERAKPREVTSREIGKAGTGERFDEVSVAEMHAADPAALADAVKTRKDRLKRHNRIVRLLAHKFEQAKARLFEYPFDCLACFGAEGFLVEVKTLDRTEPDEQKQVRDALSQLLYYETFAIDPGLACSSVRKIACFEAKPSDEHIEWLSRKGILTIWLDQDHFTGKQTKDVPPVLLGT